jgi:hypothetical protein
MKNNITNENLMAKSNQLIAKFMGREVREETYWLRQCDNNICGINPKGETLVPMTYHSSWDELMPVLDKIDQLQCNTHIQYDWHEEKSIVTILAMDNTNIIALRSGRDKLEVTYKAVVEFIEWNNDKEK